MAWIDRPGRAGSPAATAKEAPLQRATVGSVEILSIVDTHFQFPRGQHLRRAGDALASHLPAGGALALICGCAVLRTDGQTILVDTGLRPRIARLHPGGHPRETQRRA